MSNLIEGTVLGQSVGHPKKYTPEILVAVPRQLNRDQYQIDANSLPFVGFDAWHAYEISFLTKLGLPVVGVLKIVYSCDSEFLVESKSLKLYLNAFNMEQFGTTSQEGRIEIIEIISNDLSKLLNTQVKAYLHTSSPSSNSDFAEYELLDNMYF